jgi:hypothetical protein
MVKIFYVPLDKKTLIPNPSPFKKGEGSDFAPVQLLQNTVYSAQFNIGVINSKH